MSTNSIVQAALTNEWLDQQGVPNLQATWITYHYPSRIELRDGVVAHAASLRAPDEVPWLIKAAS